MTYFSLRSLLLAAFVLSNCISWTASRHHFSHNIKGHRTRHRRQGRGLYLSSTYVIPGGEGDSHGWGEWGDVSPCSRTCGGGVASQKRICLQIGPNGERQCTGGDTKYFTCETQDCPAGSRDFREEQCAEFDNQLFKGKPYKWEPYLEAPNPCELNCIPRGERFYYRHKPQVVDGTRCNSESYDVCVNGTCQPVGCDMMLGSNAREDKCRVCRGQGVNCETFVGVFDKDDYSKGYNDLLLIPEGSNNIAIAERGPSRNYLALRSKNGTYYLNGNYQIDFPRSLPIAGALWYYERSQQGFPAPDKLRCLGPIDEPLILMLLLQDDNVGIDYEYSLPSSRAPPKNKQYNWAHEEFSNCSVGCGGGFQTRNVSCRSRDDLELADEALCDADLKPPTNQTCNTNPCAAKWTPQAWSECSKKCGKGGIRSRSVLCTRIISNGHDSIVGDNNCFDLLGPKPELHQTCNENSTCPIWFTGPWKPCDKLCGEGKQTRQVVCYQKNGSRREVLNDDDCEEEKPASEQACTLQPCDGVDWMLSDWAGCDTCVSKVRTRSAVCATNSSKIVEDKFCSYHPAPVTEEPCDQAKLPACVHMWYATQWSKCLSDCGKGVQTREVFCGQFDGTSVNKVNDSFCAALPRYNDTKECEVPEEKCPSQWVAGPWTACTKTCGGGIQDRRVMCVKRGKGEPCTEEVLIEREQACNTQPCDTEPSKDETDDSEEDYDDCEDEETVEEFPEAGLDSDLSTMDDRMFSDTPTEGSGELTWSTYTTVAEHESTMNTDDLTTGELLTTGTDGGSSTDFVEGSGDSTGTDDDISTTTETTGLTSNETDSTKITESSEETSTGSTDAASTDVTETSDISGSSDTDATSDAVSTVTGVTSSTDSEEVYDDDKAESSPSTVSGSTSETEARSDGSTLSTESGATDASEASTTDATTDLSSTPVSEGTTESKATDDTDETSESEPPTTEKTLGSSESDTTDDTTESGPTTTESATKDTSGTAESESTDDTSESEPTTTESATEDTSGTSESEPTDDTSEMEPSTTDAATTDTSDTEEMEDISTTELSTSESSVSSSEAATTDSTISKSTTEPVESSVTTSETPDAGRTLSSVTDELTTETIESSNITEATVDEITESTESSTTDAAKTTESVSTGFTEVETEASTETEEGTETTISVTETSEATESTTLRDDTSITTESGSTESTQTTESGTTESAETTESTISSKSTEFGSTDATELTTVTTSEISSTDSITTTELESTDSIATELTESTESSSDSSELTSAIVTDSTTESSTSSGETVEASESSTTESASGTTPWDLSSTVAVFTTKRICKRKPKSCRKTPFGCCPDNKTPALGPFDKGCYKPETCKKSRYGCCPDGVSPAQDFLLKGCPVEPCAETLFGCCESDNKTAAEGNDQEGCPPPPPACVSSKYGCCMDETEAKGPEKEGCPETSTTTEEPTTSSGYDSAESSTTEILDSSSESSESTTGVTTDVIQHCNDAEFGCCFDNFTAATGPDLQGCPCHASLFGCCPDGVTTAQDLDLKGCIKLCNTSDFGCCQDGKTPAHGPDQEGCCLLGPFGCCPDNYNYATGPHREGCECQHSRFGCCPDNQTAATGPDNKGCGCQFSAFGCCPDRHTEASGPEFEGCLCHTYQFGCCPDGVTVAEGPNGQGCYCQQSTYGCCGDEQTHAKGPNKKGCDCATSKYGCCLDGVTEATGPKFEGCSEKPLDRQAACGLTFDRGPCRNFSVGWYYDTSYGGCSRFWYGGCEGNGNRFGSKEECEDTCVSPPPKEACRLPNVKGVCMGYNERWYYDTEKEMCLNFIYGGCLGNTNNFQSRELCQAQCEPERAADQCSLPIESGSCAGTYLRWGFDPKSRMCTQFIWGGCEGNPNRFSSEAACMLRCNPPGVPQPPELCTLPASTGDCYEYREKWYFDTKAQRCGLFYYGGCGGNENRFDSERACVDRCIPSTASTPAPRPAATEPSTSEFCFLAIDSGPCNHNVSTKWAYDYTRGKCVTFQFGGCGGNQNIFESEELCTYYCKSTQDVCQLPMLVGPCDASVNSWFYDAATDACSQFTYGGCEGNDNRFGTRAECESRCRSGSAVTTTTTTPKIETRVQSECDISPVLEECSPETMGEVWYYDSGAVSCQPHQNLESGVECRTSGTFYSQEACERSCGAFKNIDVCQYSVEAGPCEHFQPKYYYNKNTSRCEEFAYGGCLGGPNRFSTEAECEQICMSSVDPCTLPVEPGSCVKHFVLWYYSQESDSCNQFVYGGCGGNENKFDSRDACEGRCRRGPAPPTTTITTTLAPSEPPRQDEECRTPPSLTPCGSNLTAFYFDEATSACKAAEIGDCGYFNSVYSSDEECERRCGSFRGIDVCRAALDPGNCRAAIPKIYFDAASGSCKEFTYGGCAGGPNRFSTVEECQQVCANAGPELPGECAPYKDECDRLAGECPHGVRSLTTPDGCTRCDCKGSCEEQRRTCDALRCRYGVDRAVGYDGCETCKCLEDPCARSPCGPAESCLVVAARHPDTQEVVYSAQCESNEIEECEEWTAECARLSCPYGVQRTRVGRCERCACVREETDCAPLRQECERLKCHYGLNRTTAGDGCERCVCLPPPCQDKRCPQGERCVAFYDTVAAEPRYSAVCKPVNKAGWCPAEEPAHGAEVTCRQECADDADCRDQLKCCARGCARLCLSPAPPTTPLPSTTHTPDLPRAPEPYRGPEQGEPQVAAAQGGMATLRCYFHGNPPPKITWRFGEVTIDSDEGRYRLLSDGALEIVSLYRNDSGVYICIAQNEYGTSEQQVDLQVTVPVHTSLPGPVTRSAGAQISLPCEVDGYPEPKVHWTKDGVPVVTSDRIWITEARLTIERAEIADSGEYSCHAANEYSAHSSASRVTVQDVVIPASCVDNPTFANCALIVQSRFCIHKYYSKFCCKSCVEAGQLDPRDALMQADQPYYKK